MPERAGDLAIVLHSHMPYVEGFGTYPFGEEWLFDAMLRSYLPILAVAEDLTVGVTPVLADQLEAPGVAARFDAFARARRLEAVEAESREAEPKYRDACVSVAARYRRGLEHLEEAGGDLLEPFRRAAAERGVELLASTASHAVLPLLASCSGKRLQVDAGLRSHRRRFGPVHGFWLPECAYADGLGRFLVEAGITHFCVDQSAHEEDLDALAPIAAGSSLTAFSIDWTAVRWLWALDGYPADPVHADFHRESMQGTRLWSIGGDPYDPERAAARAREQAAEFLLAVAERLRAYRSARGREGLVVFAIDTELLGHWWWEGPVWLEEVIRGAGDQGVGVVTLSEALTRHEPEGRPLRASSWGEGKGLATWDSRPVADLAWAARRAELRLLRALGDSSLPVAAAKRAARELLALQASDWAFLDNRRQAGDYPYQRATAHAEAMYEAIHSAGAAGFDGDPAGQGPPDPRMRNLAPDLSLAPLLEP